MALYYIKLNKVRNIFQIVKIAIFEKRAQVQNLYLTDLYSVRKMRLFTDDSYKMFTAVRKMRLFTDKLRWLTVINGNVQYKACGALQLANAVLTGLD